MNRIAILLVAGLIASLGMPAASDCNELFPANLNDNWVLQRFSEPPVPIRVTAVTRTGWGHFEGMFDMDLWFRPEGQRVFVRTSPREQKHLLYDFAAAAGASWRVELGELVGSASVVERDTLVNTAFGPRSGCMVFSFLWDNLLDAGVVTQTFCPGIGLVMQDKASIIGTVTEQTTAASIRGAIGIGYLGQGMNVRVDRGRTFGGTVLKARLELWDTTGMRRQFRSETSQLFDIRIVNEKGETVRLWSWDKIFLPEVTVWLLEGDKDFDAELPLSDRDGRPLLPGFYTVEGWIIDLADRPAARTQIFIE